MGSKEKSQFALKQPLQNKLSKIAGLNAFAIVPLPCLAVVVVLPYNLWLRQRMISRA